MIVFSCPGCARMFSVTDNFAGRRTRCKACSSNITVPQASVKIAAPAIPAGPSVRTRRLLADARQIAEAFAGSQLIRVRALAGDPPEAYEVQYWIDGLEGPAEKPARRSQHR